MLAWKRGFCRSNAESRVLPERGKPEMKWYLEVIREAFRPAKAVVVYSSRSLYAPGRFEADAILTKGN